MHSPCYSFAIASPGEGGRCSDNKNGGDGPAATSPSPVGRGGEGRAAPLTLEPLLSLAHNDGYSNNSRGGVGGDYLGPFSARRGVQDRCHLPGTTQHYAKDVSFPHTNPTLPGRQQVWERHRQR